MKRAIWKYPLAILDEQIVMMPHGSQILCVQAQGSTPCLWAMVAPGEPATQQRFIRIFGTGHPIDDKMVGEIYIGTFQLSGGALVFHVFEEG